MIQTKVSTEKKQTKNEPIESQGKTINPQLPQNGCRSKKKKQQC